MLVHCQPPSLPSSFLLLFFTTLMGAIRQVI
jgi:hypothetical protein